METAMLEPALDSQSLTPKTPVFLWESNSAKNSPVRDQMNLAMTVPVCTHAACSVMIALFVLPTSLSRDRHSTQPSNAIRRHLPAGTFWCQGFSGFWAQRWCAEYTITLIIRSCLSRNYLNISSPWLTQLFYQSVSSTHLTTAADCFVWCQQVQSKITCVTLLTAVESLFLFCFFFFQEKPSIELKWWV